MPQQPPDKASVEKALRDLMTKGLARQAGVNENGEAVYEATPAGREVFLAELDRRDEETAA